MQTILQSAELDKYPILGVTGNKDCLPFFSKLGFEIIDESEKFPIPSWSVIRHSATIPASPKSSLAKVSLTDIYETKGTILQNSKPIILNGIQVGEKLGQGHFGQVFKGVWLESTTVALKNITNEQEFVREESLLR
jgi:hypothetical protein